MVAYLKDLATKATATVERADGALHEKYAVNEFCFQKAQAGLETIRCGNEPAGS